MSMNDALAESYARELMLSMAKSGTLQTLGPPSGTGADEARNTQRGVKDAIYLASLYRNLVTEFQK